tara:strand:- start:652 stop:1377 length:726 start_codon:yes stop_codon:yes gene_type:complete
MKTSPELNELATALSKAQGIIQNPNKDAANPFFKSKYADLADVLNVVRPAFAECGLSVVQLPHNVDGNIGLTTRLMHCSGQWLEDSIDIPFQGKNVAQEVGAAITYLRRYALAAVAGVFQEDNDGNLGKGKGSNTAPVQSIKNNPATKGHSEQQKTYFDKLIEDNDALTMFVMQRQAESTVFESLYNSFESEKVKFKRIIDSMTAKGGEQFEEYVVLLEQGHDVESEVSKAAFKYIEEAAS